MKGKATTPFRYRDKGNMAIIGRRAAVAEFRGGIRVGGTLGWISWLALHLALLVGFRNRAVVMVTWGWNFLTSGRGSRVILEPHDAPSHAAPSPVPATQDARRPRPLTAERQRPLHAQRHGAAPSRRPAAATRSTRARAASGGDSGRKLAA